MKRSVSYNVLLSVLNLQVFHLSSPSPVIVPFPFSADLSRDKNRGKEKKMKKNLELPHQNPTGT